MARSRGQLLVVVIVDQKALMITSLRYYNITFDYFLFFNNVSIVVGLYISAGNNCRFAEKRLESLLFNNERVGEIEDIQSQLEQCIHVCHSRVPQKVDNNRKVTSSIQLPLQIEQPIHFCNCPKGKTDTHLLDLHN